MEAFQRLQKQTQQYKEATEAFSRYIYQAALTAKPPIDPIVGELRIRQFVQCATIVAQSQGSRPVDPLKLMVLQNAIILRKACAREFATMYRQQPCAQLLENNERHTAFIHALEEAYDILHTRLVQDTSNLHSSSKHSSRAINQATNQFATLAVYETSAEFECHSVLQAAALPDPETASLPSPPELDCKDAEKLAGLAYLFLLDDLRKGLIDTISDFVAGKTDFEVVADLFHQTLEVILADVQGMPVVPSFDSLLLMLDMETSDLEKPGDTTSETEAKNGKAVSWDLALVRGWAAMERIRSLAEMIQCEQYGIKSPPQASSASLSGITHPAIARLLPIVPQLLQLALGQDNISKKSDAFDNITFNTLRKSRTYLFTDQFTRLLIDVAVGIECRPVHAFALEVYMELYEALNGDTSIGLSILEHRMLDSDEHMARLTATLLGQKVDWEPSVKRIPSLGEGSLPVWQMQDVNVYLSGSKPGATVTIGYPEDVLIALPTLCNFIVYWQQMRTRSRVQDLLNRQGLGIGVVFLYSALRAMDKIARWERLELLIARQSPALLPTMSTIEAVLNMMLLRCGFNVAEIRTVKAQGQLLPLHSRNLQLPTFEIRDTYKRAIMDLVAKGEDKIETWHYLHQLIASECKKQDTKLPHDIRQKLRHEKELGARNLVRAMRVVVEREVVESRFDVLNMAVLFFDFLSTGFGPIYGISQLELVMTKKAAGYLYIGRLLFFVHGAYVCETMPHKARSSTPILLAYAQPFTSFIEKDTGDLLMSRPAKGAPRNISFNVEWLHAAFEIMDLHRAAREEFRCNPLATAVSTLQCKDAKTKELVSVLSAVAGRLDLCFQ